MKILIISHQSNNSGAARVLLNMFPKLKEEQNVNLLFVLNKYQELSKEFSGKFSTKYFIPDKYKLTRNIFVRINLYNRLKIKWFKKVLKDFNPDLVYVNTIGYNLLSEYVVKSGLSYMVHVHETDNAVKMHRNQAYLIELLKKANSIICCAKYVADFINMNYKVDNLKVIYGGIDIKRFQAESHFSFRKENSLSETNTLVGVTGFPCFKKGTDIFIKAAILFNKRNINNDFIFIWYGGTSKSNDNEFFKHCLSLIKGSGFNNILFRNQIDNIGDIYSELDLFVIPSREDSFPLSMLEAMYFKVPVIGARVSGIPEALGDNCGELFESEDVESLSILFEKFITNKATFTKKSENAYQKFINNFTVEAIYPELMKILLI